MNRDERSLDATRLITSLPVRDPARRQSPRVEIGGKVSFTHERQRGEGRALNIGLGGLAVASSCPPEVGATTRLVVHFPSSEPLPFAGVVRWTHAKGFGVQFGPMGSLQTQVIIALMRQAHLFK